MNKKNLNKIDKQNVWHPFTQMSEWETQDTIMIERAKGNYLYSTTGQKLFDGVASMWTTVHGHGRVEINNAIKKQIDKVSHTTLLGLANEPSTILSEKLLKLLPKHFKKVFYSDNGSTAVEVALKMAFQYQQLIGNTKKKKFLAFTNSYHGDTVGGMSVGEIDVFVKTFNPLLFKSFRAEYPNCYRCPAQKTYPDCKLACIDSFKNIITKEHKNLAAVIVEPMIEGAFGMIPMPKGYLNEIARLCKKHNVLLIFDEVATGFGRTGKMFALNHMTSSDIKEHLKPDIICLAKGLTGGYLPLSATVTTQKIYDAFLGKFDEFKAFFHGHTFTGNQLGSAAAIASIDLFKKDDTLKKAQKKIALMEKEFNKLLKLSHVGDARGIGFMRGLEIVKDKKTKKTFPVKDRVGYKICLKAREKGLFIRPLGDTITFVPPLTITEKEIIKYTKIIRDSITEVTSSIG